MILKKLNSRKKEGFTLVEFLLASAVFSFFIVLIMVGFLQINRTYNRGVTVKDVQQTARIMLEDISRTIAANTESVAVLNPGDVSGLTSFRLCTGSIKYSWNAPSGSSYTADTYSDNTEQFIFVKSNQGNSCYEQPSSVDSSSFIEGSMNVLEDGDLVVQSLTVTPVAGLSDLYNIDLVLSTDDEALTTLGSNAECEFNAGSEAREAAKQYCSVIKVTTAVSIRKT